ncbi:uncharacterized protein LOC119606691 [Lucilia sericata]|uniref:uncharacterized protein LOC119606691 n=1 Tax=Lucilia sericata TaxID=13632 RepID=UPI0018A87F33|nr:uncharacterized protein LOC119606691 [Lucilia sericata]
MNQQKFIVSTTVVSLLACISYIVALSTEHWLEATAVLTDRLQSNVTYGLFSGSIERHQLASTLKFSLTVVCHVDLNACMYSCQRDADHRQDELRRVIHGQDLDPCEQRRFFKAKPYVNDSTTYSHDSTKTSSKHKNTPIQNTPAYISASLYICSVMFLCLAFAFSLTSLICSAINLKWHPVERIFNIFGLFVWNGIAIVGCFWSLAFWSALFGSQLRYNIAITDTLRQQLKFTSEGYASLGYSYYLVIVIMVLHIINLVLLFIRNYSISKQPHQVPNNITIDDTDARLEFY